MSLRDLLKYGILAGVFLLLLTPLFVSSSTFFPFIVGKNIAFRIIVEVIFGLWLVLALTNKEYRPNRSTLLWSVLAFVLFSGLATIFGEDPYNSFWSNFERMEGFITHLHLGALFLVLISVMRDKKLWYYFWHGSLLTALILSIYGFVQLGGGAVIHQGGVRLDATLGNATYLAVLMLLNIFVALYYLLKGGLEKHWYAIYSVLAIIFSVILYNTATRGAILGLVGGVLLLGFILLWSKRERLARVARWGIGLVLALVVVFVLVRGSNFVTESPVLSRFANISMNDNTTKARFAIWGMGLESAKEHPLLGIGPGNFMVPFAKFYNPDLYAQEPWFDHAHNAVIDWLVAAGVLGLAAYLALYLSSLHMLWRKENLFNHEEQAVLTALLAAHFFSNLFVFDNITSYLTIFAIFAYIHSGVVGNKPLVSSDKELAGAPPHVATAVVAVVVIALIYNWNMKPFRAGQNVITIIAPRNTIDESRLALLNETLEMNTFANREIGEQLSTNAAATWNNPDIPDTLKQSLGTATVELLREEAGKEDNSARLYLFLASTEGSLGLLDDALISIDRAKELSPTKQIIYFEEAAIHAARRDYESAIEPSKVAFELAPDFAEARVRYANVLLNLGRVAEADQLLIDGFGTTAYPHTFLVQGYISQGRFDRLLGVWQALVESEPENVQYRLSLAATYFEMGQLDQAEAIVQNLIDVVPDFRPQGEEFLRQIRARR